MAEIGRALGAGRRALRPDRHLRARAGCDGGAGGGRRLHQRRRARGRSCAQSPYAAKSRRERQCETEGVRIWRLLYRRARRLARAQREADLLQLLDAVAEGGGLLELERLGQVEHLAAHRRDDLGQLLERDVGSAWPSSAGLVTSTKSSCALPSSSWIAFSMVLGVMPCCAVVLLLRGAARAGHADRLPHRVGLAVGVHDHLAAHVAGGAADGLDQRPLGAQEAFLVGVEDRRPATPRAGPAPRAAG